MGGSFGDGGTSPAVGGTVGLLATSGLGLELEFAYTPDVDVDTVRVEVVDVLVTDPSRTLQSLPPERSLRSIPVVRTQTGRMLTLFTNVVREFPRGSRWRPYVAAGGGLASLSAGPGSFSLINKGNARLGLSAGGGLDLRVWERASFGADVRYVRVIEDGGDRQMARAVGRMSYRF